MTNYPPTLDRRHAATLQDMQKRLKVVESRTMGIDSGQPLMHLPGVVSATYANDGSPPLVHVNGSATLTGPYQYLSSYTPTASDSVKLVPLQGSYIIAGNTGVSTFNQFGQILVTTDAQVDQNFFVLGQTQVADLFATFLVMAGSAGASVPGSGVLFVDSGSGDLRYVTPAGTVKVVATGP
jgi:hypothetical protein